MEITKDKNEHLQFKEWLIQQISSGKFRDLEWIDAEHQRIFKLPWTKKNYPLWEEHHEIFNAWAQYRSLIRNDPRVAQQPPSHMKSNFRTILRKCSDIEELKNFHQLGLQTGNYKVYKVLTEEEVVLKRNKPVLQSLNEIDLPDNDIIEISTTSGQVGDVQLPADFNIPSSWIKRSTSLSVALLEAEQPFDQKDSDEVLDLAPKPKVRKTQSTQTKTPALDAKEVVFLSDSVTDQSSFGESGSAILKNDTEKSEKKTAKNTKTHENAEGFDILLEAAEITSDSPRSRASLNDYQTAQANYSIPTVAEFFKTLRIPEEELMQYNVLIKYGLKEVWNGVFYEFHHGYRIHNDAEETKSSLVESCPYSSIKLPAPSDNMGHFFDSVITNMHDGFVLKSDANFNLIAKRLCLSRIFVSSAFTETESSTPISLPRNEETVIFSYSQFLKHLYSGLQSKKVLPSSQIAVSISIGKKLRGDFESSKVYIGMQVIPKGAEKVLNFIQFDSDD